MSDYAEAGGRPFGGGTRTPVRLSAAVRADDPTRLEQAAYYTFLAFVAALQLSIAYSEALLTIAGVLWLVLVIRERESFKVPRMFWPLGLYAAATLVVGLPVGRSARQHPRLQATAAVLHRPDRLPAAARQAHADGRRHPHHLRGAQRHHRRRAVRPPQVRRSRPAAAGHVRDVHDVLRAVDARGVRGGGAHPVPEDRPHVGRARDAGARRRDCDHVQPERVGRCVRRHRRAVPDPRLPPAGAAPGLRRAVHRLWPDDAHRPPVVHVPGAPAGEHERHDRSQRAVDSRSGRNAEVRHAHHQGPSLDGRRARHGARRLPALPRSGGSQPAQPASSQRAGADRRGAWPPGARALGGLHG